MRETAGVLGYKTGFDLAIGLIAIQGIDFLLREASANAPIRFMRSTHTGLGAVEAFSLALLLERHSSPAGIMLLCAHPRACHVPLI